MHYRLRVSEIQLSYEKTILKNHRIAKKYLIFRLYCQKNKISIFVSHIVTENRNNETFSADL